MVGSAVAGTDGLSSKITKSKVKKIAKKQANKQLKANVSGSHVNTADNATNADERSERGERGERGERRQGGWSVGDQGVQQVPRRRH